MKYRFDETAFNELMDIRKHEKYEEDETHRMRIHMSWNGEFSGQSCPVLMIMGQSEGKEAILKNTLGFITGHIQILYEEMLKAMLPVFGTMGIGIRTDKGLVKSMADLHFAREPKDFIYRIHINPDDVKDDIGIFSLFLWLRSDYGAPENGCEFVFDHEKLLFWGDGNTGEHIYDYNSDFWGGGQCEFLKNPDPLY